jgi:hypothetical protein
MTTSPEKQVELGERERRILEVLSADLPQTARIMNPPAITEEIELGREVSVPDDELPEQEVYDLDQVHLNGLVEQELVASAEVLGVVAYAATKAGAHSVGTKVASDLGSPDA